MLVWGLWFTVTTLVLGLCLWSQVVIDTKNIVFWYVRMKHFEQLHFWQLVFLNQPMKVELFLVSLTVSLVESTGDIVVSVKGFANSTIIVFLATEVAM